MKTQNGFTLMNPDEFITWLDSQQVNRLINAIQNHHTYSPGYSHFTGNNHFALLKGMRDYHVINNGWRDIAQNLTTFPDGSIATGRPLQDIPAGIKNQNARGICIEHVGNFDAGKDQMTEAQRNTIVLVNAALCEKFNLKPSPETILYHHWFDLNTGQRTGGSGITKTCPGSAFFGGNKEDAAKKNFIPLISKYLNKMLGIQEVEIDRGSARFFYHVTAGNLNIRSGAGGIFGRIGSVSNGSILPVYEVSNQWLKIDKDEKWVSANYGINLGQASVKANTLNVRSGPGTSFDVVSSVKKDDQVFIYAVTNNWSKIAISEQWVHNDHLTFILNAPGT